MYLFLIKNHLQGPPLAPYASPWWDVPPRIPRYRCDVACADILVDEKRYTCGRKERATHSIQGVEKKERWDSGRTDKMCLFSLEIWRWRLQKCCQRSRLRSEVGDLVKRWGLYKRALYTLERALHTLERALYTSERAECTMYTLKRALLPYSWA